MLQATLITLFILGILTTLAFRTGRKRAVQLRSDSGASLHSLPGYHGGYLALWTGLPPLLLLIVYAILGTGLTDGLVQSRLEQAGEPLQVRFETFALQDEDLAQWRLGQDDGLSEPQRSQLIEARRSELVTEFLNSGAIGQVSDLSRAGFEFSTLPEERQAIFLADARALAFNRSSLRRDTPSLRSAAVLYRPYEAWFKWSVTALALTLSVSGLAYARRQIVPGLRARNRVEQVLTSLLLLMSVLAIATTIGIVLSLLLESLRFFISIDWRIHEFLFGTHWSPQMAIRSDQIGQSGVFGAVPLFAGTALITLIAMMVAVPIGLFAAIYMSEYADRRVRTWAKPTLEVLAGIPTVVYGFFALLIIGPFMRDVVEFLGYENAVNKSAISAGLVMGVMIIPFVSSLSDDVINAVPQSLRDGAYALGATKSEAIRHVVLPAALPGLIGSILLAVSRAVGETMIVVMAAGQGANLTANPLESVTTITVQIVMLLTGDQEFNSPKTLSAFALGLMLFCLTLALNYAALRVVQKYRERYE